MDTMLYPLTFAPVYQSTIWGGRRLQTALGREIPPGPVAESWEISGHPDGPTPVGSGPWSGLGLPELQAQLGEALIGRNNRRALTLQRFPLLIKILDAHRWLSVQVHPDDDYGLAHEGDLGKTEMWVVLQAEPDAELIYGFAQGVTRDEFTRALHRGSGESWLHRVPARAGDVFFVPAGAIHALGPGLLVAEIQQSSNTTYRVSDWGRLDRDGRPRPLHVDQALAVLDFDLVEPQAVRPRTISFSGHPGEEIGHCPYFHTERFLLADTETLSGCCDGSTFEIWGVLYGSATVHWAGTPVTVSGVGWVLLPAALGDFRVEAHGDSGLLRILTPPPDTETAS